MKADENNSSAETAKFHINSSFQQFSAKQKCLFDQLNIAESNTKNVLLNNMVMEVDESPDIKEEIRENTSISRHVTKQFRGKESIFKKPQARPPRGFSNRRTPDYQVNPHKWTRYSLDDVKNEDMSDRANTAAALSFLKEMELRKNQGDPTDEGTSQKIVFKKAPHKMTQNEDATVKSVSAKTAFQNSKVVMPEYVVGQKVKKEQRKKEKKVGICTKEIKLGHLLEEEATEEDI